MDNKNVLEEIRNHPHSVLILDEIEKAHNDVIHLFLQALEDSCIKDTKGKTVLFNNVIIVMTSNVGENSEMIGFNKENNLLKEKEYFSVPFLNRVDSIIKFNKLTHDDITKIINMKMKRLKDKYKEKNIEIKYNKNILNEIEKKINYKEFGARKIDKILADYVESYIIDKIIANETKINISNCTFV